MLRTTATSSMLWLAGCFDVSSSGTPPCDPTRADTICTIAGTGERGYAGDGGPAMHALLNLPLDTVVSPDGELWILDFNNYVVRAIDATGAIRTTVGNGELGDSPETGASTPAREASANHWSDLVFEGGHLYIAAWHNSRVKRVRLSDSSLENFAGTGVRTRYAGDGGPALEAALDLPSSLAVSPAGNLVVMDQGNQVIREIVRSSRGRLAEGAVEDASIDQGGVITTIAGRCVVDMEMPCGENERPIACPDSQKLVCGSTDQCAHACTPGFAGDGGPAGEARIAQPYGSGADPGGKLAYDSAGNLVFADKHNHRIRRIARDGVITTIAGTGTAGYAGDDGLATRAQLHSPTDIAIAADDTIYFTDVLNDCVRKIEADVITRVAGRCGEARDELAPLGDGGSPRDATLHRPYGIELSPDGELLYISDTFHHRVLVANLRHH